jgi:hypothetical protein
MKNVTPQLFTALLLASAGLLYCGGDDSNSGSGAGGGSTGTNAGTGGATSGPGTGSSSSSSSSASTTSSTTTNPTTGGGGTAGSGGAGGAGGGMGGRMGRDGGGVGGAGGRMGRDGGGMGGGGAPGDAGGCPAFPNNGGRCATVGEVCPYAGGITCTCEMGNNGDRFTCTGGGRDGGFMFDANRGGG